MSRLSGPVPTPTLRVGSGEPMLLLHPFMLCHEVWADVLPTLAEDFDVVAATLPGHWGGPALRRRDTSLAAFADGVEALMDDLGWETCHLAGNSIGGWLALELARRGRARSVVAIAPAGGWRRLSSAQLLVGARFLSMVPLVALGWAAGDGVLRLGPVVRRAMHIVSADPQQVSQAQLEAFVRATTHCSAFLPYVWSDLCRGGMQDLASIEVPVRLVLCGRDWLLPPDRYGAAFREELADPDVVELADAGHVPMYDDPALIAELIVEHAARSPPRATTVRLIRTGPSDDAGRWLPWTP